MLSVSYNYNHILTLLAAVALFYVFYHMRIKQGYSAALSAGLRRIRLAYISGMSMKPFGMSGRTGFILWQQSRTMV